jgi:hypothetical protein
MGKMGNATAKSTMPSARRAADDAVYSLELFALVLVGHVLDCVVRSTWFALPGGHTRAWGRLRVIARVWLGRI